MTRLKGLSVASCLALSAFALMPSAQAGGGDKETIVTFPNPVEVPGTVLQPGTYVFELMKSPSNLHHVQIIDQRTSNTVATVQALPDLQRTPSDTAEFSYWQTPAGEPAALRAWFFPGDQYGQEFAYPQNVASRLAQANNEQVPTLAPSNQVVMTNPPGGFINNPSNAMYSQNKMNQGQAMTCPPSAQMQNQQSARQGITPQTDNTNNPNVGTAKGCNCGCAGANKTY
jgi:hypothetical protein